MFTLVVDGCPIQDAESIGPLVEAGEKIRKDRSETMWQVYEGLTEIRHCLDWDKFSQEFGEWFDKVFSAS